MTFKLLTVGIAELEVAEPPDILRTILGSCIGVCLYDNKNKIGGLSHIMLPKMNDINSNKKKYADTAIPILLEKMHKKGANADFITAKIIGGATMFNFSQKSSFMNIGQSNAISVKNTLTDLKIRIIAEELGGEFGRTIDFYMDTGAVRIKYLNKQINII
ncbi:MAG: chemotaxis protein CheD [Spirochaetes bacterium]|nr:chemotaxis protein CheD [Spirochaetota bacterium]